MFGPSSNPLGAAAHSHLSPGPGLTLQGRAAAPEHGVRAARPRCARASRRGEAPWGEQNPGTTAGQWPARAGGACSGVLGDAGCWRGSVGCRGEHIMYPQLPGVSLGKRGCPPDTVTANSAGRKRFCFGVQSPCSVGFRLCRPRCLRTQFVCTIQPPARPGSRPPPGRRQPRKASSAECCCEKFSCYRFSTSKHAKKLRSAYPTFLPCYFSPGHRC